MVIQSVRQQISDSSDRDFCAVDVCDHAQMAAQPAHVLGIVAGDVNSSVTWANASIRCPKTALEAVVGNWIGVVESTGQKMKIAASHGVFFPGRALLGVGTGHNVETLLPTQMWRAINVAIPANQFGGAADVVGTSVGADSRRQGAADRPDPLRGHHYVELARPFSALAPTRNPTGNVVGLHSTISRLPASRDSAGIFQQKH